MKKTLALVLALAMVFSTITVAFAEDTLGEDAQVCKDLGMLQGEGGTVDAAYAATAPTRLQAAVMFLRLKGLEAEALAFTGEDNFADGEIAWAEGANLIAYLKANPQLGWIGDGTNFNPNKAITAQEYYKVLLEALGYKQTTAEVAGDFTWDEVLTFAASVGLSKVADVADFTVNDLAIATVEALKVNVKGTEEALYKSLVTEEAAVAAGLVEAAPAAVTAVIDEVEALGNTVVQVVFEEDIDEAAANVDNYAIEGLEIKDAVVAGPDVVRLYTAAQSAGKLYTLTMGEQSVKFSGLAKVSDGPQITDVVSEDVEEVVITFDRKLDFASATDAATYSIKGVTVVSVEIDPDDPDEVILTTEGLKDNTNYTVKVTDIKSVDLVNRKTTSDDFKTKYDKAAPKINDAYADTNERVIVKFNEKVSKESAEDPANYAIKVDETDGAELAIVSIEWDDDDEDNVEIVTESMEKNEDYKISISNIADQRKVPNVMTRAYSKVFESKKVDDKAPTYAWAKVISPTKFIVRFEDDSRLDADSILDKGNYNLECDKSTLDIEDIEKYKSDTGYFEAIFTVEEMSTKTCKLTIVDILDEFGNAMKEVNKTFTPDEDDFASAQIYAAVATDKNTVILYLYDVDINDDGKVSKSEAEATPVYTTQNLDKDSANNIANYSINGDIGTPTKAEFEYKVSGVKQKYMVRLTVNSLVNGGEYDLSVDGLKDIAGNVLVIDEGVTIDTTTNVWNSDCEVESAEALSRYVVALTFDEEVKYAPGAYITLDTDPEGAGDFNLLAKAYAEDDTVIEFSDYTKQELTPGTDYYVTDIYGVTNKAGGELKAFTVSDLKVTASANDKPEYAEVESIEQIDADTVKIVMSRNVLRVDDDTDFRVILDGKKKCDETVFLRKDDGIAEDHEYTVKLHELLTDEHGIPVVDDDNVTFDKDTHIPKNTGITQFEGDDLDKTGPDVDDVVALARNYVEITFDEYIADFDDDLITIVNIDDKNSKISIDWANSKINGGSPYEGVTPNVFEPCEGSVLQLALSEPLEARYEYELRLELGAVVDYAGNKSAADTFSFDGSNLLQH